ncbi:MAG: GNAT family N-acetyltransferase [Dongiaceae bacterium]
MSNIRRATEKDAEAVGTMLTSLLAELYPDQAPDYRPERAIETARALLDADGYCAFLALMPDGEIGGVVGLSECKAIYAHGIFGEIVELYVKPEYRSAKVGARLIDAAIAFANAQGWSMLEVGAPDVPRWQRTVDFYLRSGFTEIGPQLFLDLGKDPG